MEKDEYYRIAKLEFDHWWYQSLRSLVLKHIVKNFNNKDIKVIDAGCGTGGLISFLKHKGYENVEGFDLSDTAVKICSGREIPVLKADLKDFANLFEKNYADLVISNDTFYFLDLEEQITLANNINDVLKEGGCLIVNMPSLKAFHGSHDFKVGIKKRFESNDIWKIFNKDRYKMVTKTYWPFLISPLIWITRFVQRMRMRLNLKKEVNSDLKREARFINSFLFTITQMENKLLQSKPFGSSMFLVMKKINS